jgi:hypothetical protein
MTYETNIPGTNRVNDPSSRSDDTSGASLGARSSADDVGREASGTAEQVRATAADSLDSAANAVHSGGARVASAAHSAADSLSSGAQYVRERDARDMIEDLREVVRNNPGSALLGAVALGFVVGRALYRH